MVLNKDCIRDVLIYIEQHCIYYKDKENAHQLHEVGLKELSEDAKLSQYPYDDIHYTIQKLFEGDYIQGYYIPKNDPHTFKVASIKSLSLKGHDLLDNLNPNQSGKRPKIYCKRLEISH